MNDKAIESTHLLAALQVEVERNKALVDRNRMQGVQGHGCNSADYRMGVYDGVQVAIGVVEKLSANAEHDTRQQQNNQKGTTP